MNLGGGVEGMRKKGAQKDCSTVRKKKRRVPSDGKYRRCGIKKKEWKGMRWNKDVEM